MRQTELKKEEEAKARSSCRSSTLVVIPEVWHRIMSEPHTNIIYCIITEMLVGQHSVK